MIYTLDLVGTGVFAVAGSLAAGKKNLDLFGVVVLAMATALGGGTLRDVILGAHPIFWINDPTYVIVVATASVLTFVGARYFPPPVRLLVLADAVGLAVFTIIGAQKALAVGSLPVIAVLMGVMTGVAGGMIRDVLAGEIPLILRREIYATASLCGAIVFVAAGVWMPAPSPVPGIAGVAVALGLRLAAIRWNLSLPVFPASRGNGKG